MALSYKGARLPPASLQLLVPPVRLMSALVWRVAQERSVLQYDKVLDFISLVIEIVPEILNPIQKAQLIMGLRARLVLELCQVDGVTNLKTIQNHLDKIHSCSSELSANDQMENSEILSMSYRNFATLVQKILSDSFEKEIFFHEVFPQKYGSAFNQEIQQLVSVFLVRLEQLLPIPDLQETSALLAGSSAPEEFSRSLSDPAALKTLLLQYRERGTLSSTLTPDEEDIILHTLAHPPENVEERLAIDCTEADDDNYDSDGRSLEDLDEESAESLEDTPEDWDPKKESGLVSHLYICPECSFAHLCMKKIHEHIQKEHQKSGIKPKKVSSKTGSSDIQIKNKKLEKNSKKEKKCVKKNSPDKKLNCEQNKDKAENRKSQRRKEPTGVDKRFLSMRPVNKNFSEEETKCQLCEKVFEHPNQLKFHMRIHSSRYHCSQCEKGFSSQSGYYHHQRIHKKGRIFICDLCNKGFLCNSSLNQHKRLHAGPTNLCNICGKNFSKNGFVRHMQMHKGEKNYLCTTCGKSFFSSGELHMHDRTHTGETPYTCIHCGKGFSCKGHLTVHLRSHTGERPYACLDCPKRFLTVNCLKRHALSHSGVKPFKCTKCEKEFSQQGNLKRHLATHKPDK
ncbi:zinc finger protein 436 isoform X2 [Oryzias melastigma]|uniref:Zinc finger protein 436-like n=1 Tax=Oryzias melastigma TaxID=30732 RepID=A0A3B3BRQ8_ORYME|nr:zinc finger protein 436 isoform X2 [Oryzias melastigma]